MPFEIGNPGGPGRPENKQNSGKSRYERRKHEVLITKYGITLDEYDELLKKQKGVCAICGKPETKIVWNTVCRLTVDHDHKSGVVRGLLCFRCNTGIGKLYDDPEILRKAANYLDNKRITSENDI